MEPPAGSPAGGFSLLVTGWSNLEREKNMVRLVVLSHPFGDKCSLWPYFEDIKIERIHYHAKSGVYTQRITTTMHCTTHADSPAHVFEGGMYTDEIPLERYYGTGVVVDVGNPGKWGNITGDMLEKASPKIQRGDIVMVHTHMHAIYADTKEYFAYSPGLAKSAGEWFVERGVKAVGVDQQALDHPLSTAIGPHGPGPVLPRVNEEYKSTKESAAARSSRTTPTGNPSTTCSCGTASWASRTSVATSTTCSACA
jgi:kynurenine formamidase